jgi:hypothetical protein
MLRLVSRIGGIYRSSAADWHRLFCGDASPIGCSDYRLRNIPLAIRSRATYLVERNVHDCTKNVDGNDGIGNRSSVQR